MFIARRFRRKTKCSENPQNKENNKKILSIISFMLKKIDK